MNRLLTLLLCLAAPAAAMELSRFSCQRPEPVEIGSATNAAIASELVHGIKLKPGEVFSFNAAMTPGLDRFVPGTAYASGRVIRSEGGGICQVSAALYNAALLAGLEVLERHSHSVYDPLTAYVPAGRDSAISRGVGADLRFRNSTAAPMTLSVTAQGGLVEAVLLGRQRRPRQRWIETEEVKRYDHELRWRDRDNLEAGEKRMKQKGFDGLKVRRRLCGVNAQGLTRCVGLGSDSYMQVTEVWEQGPPLAVGPTPVAESAAPQEHP